MRQAMTRHEEDMINDRQGSRCSALLDSMSHVLQASLHQAPRKTKAIISGTDIWRSRLSYS